MNESVPRFKTNYQGEGVILVEKLKVACRYHTVGDPGRPPLLFLHGFMGDGRVWLPTMNQLQDVVYSVALDLPGHGNTEADLAHLDFGNLAETVAAFVYDHFDRPAVLVGYSLGGRVALHAALSHPDRFRGLVLESASAGIEDKDERLQRLEQDEATAAKLCATDMRSFLTEWYQQPLFSSLRPETVAGIIDRKAHNDPLRLAEVVVKLSPGRQSSLWDRVSAWNKPALIVAGELDEKYRAQATRLAGQMKRSSLQIVPGAGHIVHLENNAGFVEALKSFLDAYIL
ncbi:MAG: 2-succinyl-6-hydroxy-2,4-cyclohexadiene-1-carboxylate synthase [candidate division Zixibacteria bacterium]|nr:2-succinyl-6-hydroxy-2,4-cyclohexadiene-1-carboxylate synthase [candidate division Zixibacteria bacterium]